MGDNHIITTRVFDAPRALVYRAWTEPEHLAVWWGPVGFTNTIHQFDLQVGGHWKLTMHGPQGGNYENESFFLEIITNEKLVWDRITNPLFKVTVLFEEEGDKTKVTFTMEFANSKEYQTVKPIVIPANEENFDRLAAELNRMKP
ncbi:MAG: SRPBCC family protein [Mucilaginibacter sp.]|uniref:SRPBCC family protein n=1 Tax=Mucilaginibacter sp. TaxID=1882438 RepID=UPI00326548FA